MGNLKGSLKINGKNKLHVPTTLPQTARNDIAEMALNSNQSLKIFNGNGTKV